MGSSLNAKCRCGFSVEELLVGGGMMNFQSYCGAPAFCDTCADVVVANYFDDKPACPNCKKAITFYDDPSLRRKKSAISKRTPMLFSWTLGRTFEMRDTEYLCPKCNRVWLKFSDAGIDWD